MSARRLTHMFRPKNSGHQPTLELTIDSSLYERIKERAYKDGTTESEALLEALDRGMRDFGLHLMGEYKEDWAVVEQLNQECQQDNAVLKAIEVQNERFRQTLDEYRKGTLRRLRT